MKMITGFALAVLLAVPAGAAAQEAIGLIAGDGPLSEYGQRAEGVTIGAGNAKEANTAIHAIDPSPPSARNRAIPGSGERLSRAIRRYQDVTKITEGARALASESSLSGGSGSSSGSSSSGK
jgi:hypothetical protein